MHGLAHDLRFTLRQLRNRPGFAAVAVVTLALGIGANAAIFSVASGVLLDPLPYRQPERLAIVYSQFPNLGFDRFWVSPPEYLELSRWARSFERIGAYAVATANLSGGEQPLRVTIAYASASLFPALGVAPLTGRAFTAAEDLPNAEPVVVLGHGLWQRAFGGDPALLGRTVEVDGVARTVVGIMPPRFDIEDSGVEAWLPLGLDPADPGGRGSHYLLLVGRLAPGVGFPQARQELAALVARWDEEFPDNHAPRPEIHELVIRPLKEDLVGEVRPAVLLLAGAVGFVLLIACANVANLLLARAEARHKEIAVRSALGAGWRRLLRQLLTESVVLALAGGALGLGLAFWGVNALLAANPDSLPRVDAIALDGRVLAFTLVVALGTGVLFGLAPAFHLAAGGAFGALKEGGRATAGRGRQRFRRALVVAEVALAVMLVIGAGLLLKSFRGLARVDVGFEPAGVLTFQIALPEAAYPEAHQVTAFYGRLLERLETLPGVESAAAMSGLPPVREVDANDTEFEGVASGPDSPPHNVDYYQYVSGDYFETLKIPLVAGRAFTAADAGGAMPVAIVNETLARTFWPDASPLGRRLRTGWRGDEEPWFTVVGVAADVKQGGVDQPTGTELYWLADQLPAHVGVAPRQMNVVLRIAGEELALAAAVRRQVRELDPSLPVADLKPLEQVVGDSLARSRFLAVLVGVFAVVALLLAVVGTYGVLAYAVAQRRHEMGLRMALGARAASVLGLILGEGMGLVVAGLAVGLLGVFALRPALARVLFGVAPTDPATLATVALLLAGVAFLACFIPARRATRVDPATALRME